MTHPWTNVDDLVVTLRKRWNTGRYARDYAAGVPWTPITLTVTAPTAAELLDYFDEAVQWAEKFRRDSHTQRGHERFAVEHRTIQGKHLGANLVPARIRLDTFEQLCTLLSTIREVRALDELVDLTRTQAPELLRWVIDHPLLAVAHHNIWSEVLATISWITAQQPQQLHLRHIDVPGVDTKFVENIKGLLNELLTLVLPAERIDAEHTASDFTRRFRFQPKPHYTRFRLLCPTPLFSGQITELVLRTDEFASLEPTVGTVFVVENEVSYLAFPDVPDSIVVFGSGFDLTTLRELPWLDRKHIVYWGDIDTHGFVMLSRLRSRFGAVQSILMDRETLLAHPNQRVTEPKPTNQALQHLTAAEAELYRDLVEDRYGVRVRLEQERVRFSLLNQALLPFTS